MAYTTVVVNSFVHKMTEVLEQLERERGEITLAVMTPFDIGTGERWSLYLSAPWLDKMGLREGTQAMREYFRSRLGSFADRFQQTFIVRTSDSEVSVFSSKFDVPELGTAYRVIGLDLDRFYENDAILFVARPASASDRQPQTISA